MGFLILLFIISIFIAFINYTPGTFLSGWDTLHPEFNLSLNLQRVIFGVFRENQGLGAVAAHAHMVELPRILLFSLLSLAVPIDFLRFLYFFLMLILGPLGIYFFLIQKNKIAAFLGALFYLLNLGTLQHFYVPFEMFATLYGFLPWLFLFAKKFLTNSGRKNLILFSLVTFLSTPMAYATTLWYVYFAALCIYTLTFLSQERSFQVFLRLVVIIITTLLINSYWLLPNLYFLKTHSNDIREAKINELFSEEAFAKDTKYATVENVVFLKGFLFDWQKYRNGEFTPLLGVWQKHLENPFILGVGWFLFGLIVLGVIISTLRRDKNSLIFLPLFGFSIIFLLHGQWPLNHLFSFLRENIPIFREAFRFPWTKFSILVMFCYAFYFSNAIYFILDWLKEKRVASKFVLSFLTSLLIIWMLPAFKGELISPSMRIKIPDEYFQVFEWFNKQPSNERIGTFPVYTFRGWEYYNFGFEGAGFIWFGLKQPVLVRDFDRWTPSNENFYWESSYALYSKNLKLLEAVLEKYQVSYLLLDGNVFNPSSSKSVYLDELEEMLSASSKIKLAQTFGNVKIYKVNLDTPVNNFVFLSENLPTIQPEYKWGNLDRAYLENGNYLSIPASSYFYPFRTLFSGKSQKDLEFEVEDRGDYFAFKKQLPKGLDSYFLEVPEIKDEELLWVDPSDLSKTKILLREVYFNGSLIEVKVPKVGGFFSAEIEANQLRNFLLESLPHEFSYLIEVESKNLEGKPLIFWLENLNGRRADIESYLPETNISTSFFIQPPMEKDGLGYALHFDQVRFGNEKSKNELGKITVNPIPFDFLSGLKLKKENILAQAKLTKLEVDHPNPSIYSISIPGAGSQILQNPVLVLSQSYEQGWKAYKGTPFFGKEIKDHVLINNWANGWVLKNSELPTTNSKLNIVFVPQYLEFLGMFSAVFWMILVLFVRRI